MLGSAATEIIHHVIPFSSTETTSTGSPGGETIPLSAVELADRAGDGLEVFLWWDCLTGGLWVEVRNRLGSSWTVAAAPERALDVFYHRFAYCDADVEEVFEPVG